MQTLSCVVRLNGDLTFTVDKSPVTPAEILILRSIHGDDAVVSIKSAGHMDKRSHKLEKERLVARYSAKVVEALFPGAAPRLPVTLDDLPEIEQPVDDDMASLDKGEVDAAIAAGGNAVAPAIPDLSDDELDAMTDPAKAAA